MSAQLFVAHDADREPTLWRRRANRPDAPAPVLRRCDLPSEHRDLWDRLTAALGADVATGVATERWRCDAHGLWTSSDCPRCDDELIALTAKKGSVRRCQLCDEALVNHGLGVWACTEDHPDATDSEATP